MANTNTCEICGKTFETAKGLRQHINVHGTARPFVCDHCQKGFRFRSNLYEHKSIHSVNAMEMHQCNLCSHSTRLKGNLKKHMKCHATKKPMARSSAPVNKMGSTSSGRILPQRVQNNTVSTSEASAGRRPSRRSGGVFYQLDDRNRAVVVHERTPAGRKRSSLSPDAPAKKKSMARQPTASTSPSTSPHSTARDDILSPTPSPRPVTPVTPTDVQEEMEVDDNLLMPMINSPPTATAPEVPVEDFVRPGTSEAPIEHDTPEEKEENGPAKLALLPVPTHREWCFERICRLTEFPKAKKPILEIVMGLAESDVFSRVNHENIDIFFVNDVSQAIRNYEEFLVTPEKFHDLNSGIFECEEEDGIFVETPLPPKPEVWPSQIQKREEEQLRVHQEAVERAQFEAWQRWFEQLRQQQLLQLQQQQQLHAALLAALYGQLFA